MNTSTETTNGWCPGMVSNLESKICSLFAVNIREFGTISVDIQTIVDIVFGSGAYGSLSPQETLRLICEDYNWTFQECKRFDKEIGHTFYWWVITENNDASN